MALNLEDKKALVAEVAAVAAGALSAVAAQYRGLTVSQLTEFRSKARAAGVYVRVVKNSLARRAVSGTTFECMAPVLKGPLVLAFSKDDPGAAARVVKAFAKDNEKLVPTAISLSGKLLTAKDLDRVASPADARAGAVDTAGCDAGSDPEAGRHARGYTEQARTHAGRGQGPEAGGRRLSLPGTTGRNRIATATVF